MTLRGPGGRFLLGCVALAGALVVAMVAASSAPSAAFTSTAAEARHESAAHLQAMRTREIRERFDQALVMMHARQYEHAATALQRVLTLAPRLPEAQVNLGFALLELQQLDGAHQAFERAIEARADQANAYYGLALVLDRQGDRAGARGAMRTFVHLVRDDHPFKARARAALWEWDPARPAGTP